jgi:hypothetical protein
LSSTVHNGSYHSAIFAPGYLDELSYTPVVEMKHGEQVAEATARACSVSSFICCSERLSVCAMVKSSIANYLKPEPPVVALVPKELPERLLEFAKAETVAFAREAARFGRERCD